VQYEEAPVFYPTVEEFADLTGYIKSIEPACEEYGLARVVPPEGFGPTSVDMSSKARFETKLQKLQALGEGTSFEDGRTFTVSSFRKQADKFKAARGYAAGEAAYSTIEQDYWDALKGAAGEDIQVHRAPLQTSIIANKKSWMMIEGSPASWGWFRSMERTALFRCGLSVQIDLEGEGCTVHFWGVHDGLSQSEATERFFALSDLVFCARRSQSSVQTIDIANTMSAFSSGPTGRIRFGQHRFGLSRPPRRKRIRSRIRHAGVPRGQFLEHQKCRILRGLDHPPCRARHSGD
jgi:hypothetical protein